MPRNIPTYTQCAGPGVARSHTQIGGLAGTLVNAFFANKLLTVLAFVGYLIGLVLLSNPIAYAATGTAIIVALVDFKNWYYFGRLLCVREDECAIGTVISEPEASFDGDRKLNLMLAPFSQRESVQTLIDHISANESMLINNANFNDPPFHTSAPALPVAAQRENDFSILQGYIQDLAGENPANGDASSNMYRQLLIGSMNRLLSDPTKNIFSRFYRKEPAHITEGSALWDAIPEDFDTDPAINWNGPNAQSTKTHENPYTQSTETLNPMFQFDREHLVPYLHCEIEGYYIRLLIDNVIMAFSAWLAALIALWGILGPLAPAVAAAIALVLFFLKWLLDQITGNDGDAAEPDIDFDDPDAEGDPFEEKAGDVVVVFGDWIMDTEHFQYFEIHPVRAFHIVAQNSLGEEPVLVDGNVEQERFGHKNFDPREIDQETADKICEIISEAEGTSPDDEIGRREDTLLSYGMKTFYAGAGIQVDNC